MEQLKNNTVGDLTPTVVYTGHVTIKYKDRSGKECIVEHHNDGATGLFSAICRMLAGLPVDKYIPNALMAYTGTGTTKSKGLAQNVTYTTAPVTYGEVSGSWQTDTTNPSKIRYSFIIPSELILNPQLEITQFRLFNSLSTICAVVTLTSEEYIQPEEGSNIILYWDMSFAGAGQA